MCIRDSFYHQRGPGALNRGYALRYATALLEEIIARADSALVPVSYTHLDVYKRQVSSSVASVPKALA